MSILLSVPSLPAQNKSGGLSSGKIIRVNHSGKSFLAV